MSTKPLAGHVVTNAGLQQAYKIHIFIDSVVTNQPNCNKTTDRPTGDWSCSWSRVQRSTRHNLDNFESGLHSQSLD